MRCCCSYSRDSLELTLNSWKLNGSRDPHLQQLDTFSITPDKPTASPTADNNPQLCAGPSVLSPPWEFWSSNTKVTSASERFCHCLQLHLCGFYRFPAPGPRIFCSAQGLLSSSPPLALISCWFGCAGKQAHCQVPEKVLAQSLPSCIT